MQQVFRIDGMHCGACVNRVSKALQPLARSVTVTLEPPQAQLDSAAGVSIEELQRALARVGDYRASALPAP
jgi:Cu+-exporting ATPase